MRPGAALGLLKESFNDWSEDGASRLAAALSYYTIFSLAPLLLIVTAIAGVVFGDEAARGQVSAQLSGLLGPEAAETIESAVSKARDTGAGTISAIIGIVMLFLCGFVQSICMVMMTIAMLRGADPRYRGRVMSLRTFAVLGLPLGLLVSGPLIDRFGFAATGTSYAAIGLILALAAAVYWRDHLWRIDSPANAR